MTCSSIGSDRSRSSPEHSISSHFSGLHGNHSQHDNQSTSHQVISIPDTCSVLPSSEEMSSEQGIQFNSKETSPAPDIEQQGKFRSDYYSLCNVGSNRSLLSSGNDGELDNLPINSSIPHTCQTNSEQKCEQCSIRGNNQEFDEISRQLESLSKTVNALHRSLTSLNSCDTDKESNEDHSDVFNTPSENFKDTEGYQWVEDDFYLTPCGGELIMGNSPFSDTGACCDWVNEYADDTSCNDEFEFYGNFSSEPISTFGDEKSSYPPIREEENDVDAFVSAPSCGTRGGNSPSLSAKFRRYNQEGCPQLERADSIGVIDSKVRTNTFIFIY